MNLQHLRIVQCPARLDLSKFPWQNKHLSLRAPDIHLCITGNSGSRPHANETGSSA